MTKKPRKRLSVVRNENAVIDALVDGPKDAYRIARMTDLSHAGVKKIAKRLCRRIGVTKIADKRGQRRKNQYYLMRQPAAKAEYPPTVKSVLDDHATVLKAALRRGRRANKASLVDELEVLLIEKVELKRQIKETEESISKIKKTLST